MGVAVAPNPVGSVITIETSTSGTPVGVGLKRVIEAMPWPKLAWNVAPVPPPPVAVTVGGI